MKTFMANPAKIDRKWYVVDAEGQTLGRLASEVAKVLRGKNKPDLLIFDVDIPKRREYETVEKMYAGSVVCLRDGCTDRLWK